MKLTIAVQLDYGVAEPTDMLLEIEAAMLPEQWVEHAHIALSPCEPFARVPAHDGLGERLWLRAADRLTVDYNATVDIRRSAVDWRALPRVAPHRLPGETVQYLLPSRYCAPDPFQKFINSEFAGLDGGARVGAMRDWIETHFSYVAGVSTAATTALDSFARREGVCRDYAHVLITLARAAGIPARIASVYAPRVTPQDFHAVAEIFLGGGWHLVDPTGMAEPGEMAKIGVGRDAADIAFLTVFGSATLNRQTVAVTVAG